MYWKRFSTEHKKTIVIFLVLFGTNPKVLFNNPLTTLNAVAVAAGPDVIEHFTQLGQTEIHFRLLDWQAHQTWRRSQVMSCCMWIAGILS